MGFYEANPRMKVLRAWLNRIDATCMYQAKSPSMRKRLDVYLVGSKYKNGPRMFIVTLHLDEQATATGWDIYVPASESADISLTLDAAAESLGVDGCRGLVEGEANT